MRISTHQIKIILFFIFLNQGGLFAQSTRGGDSPSSKPSSSASANTIETDIIDTVQLRYFTLKDRDKIVPFEDTLIDNFEKYQINKQFEHAALDLGNLGSAHQPVRYQSRDNIFTDAGFHQYDNYRFDPEDLRYFILDRAFNDLYFSPLAGQNNFLVKAKFARNFDKKTQISLDYERILNEGIYNNQKTKSTRFVVGLWKQSESGKHEYFINFSANNHNEEINGGVVHDSLLNQPFARVRNTIAVNLDGDTTRFQNFSYGIDNFFNIKKGKYKVHHGLKIGTGYFRYGDHDADNESDSLVYLSYLTDDRGIRYFLGYHNIKNDFDLSFNSKSIDFKLGISHYYQSFDDSFEKTNVNDLVLKSQLDFKIKKKIDFRGLAEIGVGKNAGNLNLNGNLSWRPFSKIKIQGDVQILRYDSYINQRSVIVVEKEIFNNDFSKVNEFNIGGQIDFEGIGISAGFRSGIIDNAIHYNNMALPVQKDGSTEYVQLQVNQKLKWKFIGIENSLLYQNFSDNIYRLPKVYSIHKAYVELRLFKRVLLTQVGMLFYNIQYDGSSQFMPVTGSFYPSDVQVDYFPYSEFFANFKVKQFRLFIKIENFTDMITREEHYQVVNYPQFDYNTMIGVRWLIRG